jgi:hypothetical protein
MQLVSVRQVFGGLGSEEGAKTPHLGAQMSTRLAFIVVT